MHPQPLLLRTEWDTVLLRAFVVKDAKAMFDLLNRNREHLSRWGDVTALKYPDEKSVVQSIRHPVSPNRLRMGIWRNDDLVGSINLTALPAPHHAEIGYWLGQEYMGKGLMTVATRSLVSYAFETLGYSHLKANVRKENKGSQRVLERVGFRITSEVDVYLNYALHAYE